MSVEFEALEKEGRCCLTMHLPQHSHKKRKDSLKTRAVLLMFLVELEISGVAVQGIHQNINKFLFSVRIFLVKITLRMFWPFSVFMTMVQPLLRELNNC